LTAVRKVVSLNNIAAEELHGGGIIKKIITKETTGINICFCQTKLRPGAGHRWHVHDNEDMIIFIIKGNGTMYFEDEEVSYGPQMAIIVPRGLEHQNLNTSDEDIISVTMYIPAS